MNGRLLESIFTCIILFSIPFGAFWIPGIYYYNNGYSSTYGGWRSPTQIMVNITNYKPCKSYKKFQAISEFIYYKELHHCKINLEYCYSEKYLKKHYKIGNNKEVLLNLTGRQKCITKDVSNKYSKIGFILTFIGLFFSAIFGIIFASDDNGYTRGGHLYKFMLYFKILNPTIQINRNIEIVPHQIDETKNFDIECGINEYTIIKEDNLECSICTSNILNNRAVLKCGHSYHQKCIDDWFICKKTCPLCRQK